MNCIWSGIKLFWTLQNAECQRRETQHGQPVMRNAAMRLREPGTKQVAELLTSLWQPVCYFGTMKKVSLHYFITVCAQHIVTSTSPCSGLFEYETHVTKISNKITHMGQSHNGCTVYITLHVKLSKLIECHACKHCLLYLPCMFDFLDQFFFFL